MMKISTWPIKNILMIFIVITFTIQAINYTVYLYLGDRMKGGIEKLVKETEELKEVAVFIEEVTLVSINIRDALLQEDREETPKLINKTNEELKKA